MTAPAIVADFDVGDARPSARDLVAAAAARGAAFVAVDVVDGADERPEAHVRGRMVARLARLADEARPHRIGLFLRLRDTLSIAGLREALDVTKGVSAASLRDRVLVVVDGERVGKRLRREAPEFPSALEIVAARRGLARFLPANFRRAAAEADDLVVSWNVPDVVAVVDRLAPNLADRGARVWVSDVPDPTAAGAIRASIAGCVVRFPLATSELGV